MEAYVEMGRVLEAHNTRFVQRHNTRKQFRNVASARSDYNDFGMFEDCGSSYASELDAAKAVSAFALAEKVASERHFKKLKLTFAEKYPEFADELANRLKVQSAKHTQMLKDEVAAKLEEKRERERVERERRDPWGYREKMARKARKAANKTTPSVG